MADSDPCPKADFQCGDLVALKSGGPMMTIEGPTNMPVADNVAVEMWVCHYYVSHTGIFQKVVFPAQMLSRKE